MTDNASIARECRASMRISTRVRWMEQLGAGARGRNGDCLRARAAPSPRPAADGSPGVRLAA